MKNKKVLILYKFLPQYRVDFFNKLRVNLSKNNIDLILIYGKLKDVNSKKKDEQNIDWAIYRENKIIKLGKTNLIWQSSLDMIPEVDLVIVEQANRLLINYVLLFLSKWMKFKFAFWGHGSNLQDNPKSLKNKFKYFFLNQSDHWFAYTKGVKEFLIEKGVSKKKITIVNNAIDTISLRKEYVKVSEEEINNLRRRLDIKGNNIALYCGGIYKEKRIDFLIKTVERVKEKIIDFEFIIIGSGPESYLIESWSNKHNWVHYVGVKFNLEKVIYFKISNLFLMPGAVGLAILDSFAMQTPLITTDIPIHGPEIEYLIEGENGIITKNDIQIYSNQVIDLLLNENKVNKLKNGCLKSSKFYNTEDMVENFKDGILECLKD